MFPTQRENVINRHPPPPPIKNNSLPEQQIGNMEPKPRSSCPQSLSVLVYRCLKGEKSEIAESKPEWIKNASDWPAFRLTISRVPAFGCLLTFSVLHKVQRKQHQNADTKDMNHGGTRECPTKPSCAGRVTAMAFHTLSHRLAFTGSLGKETKEGAVLGSHKDSCSCLCKNRLHLTSVAFHVSASFLHLPPHLTWRR